MTSVLIAEDDVLMADMLEDIVVAAGYQVCGIARTVADGVALGRQHKPDLALLDLRLADGGLGTEIASQLDRGGGMAVLYTTGNAGEINLTKDDGEASLGKPYRSVDLVRAIEIVEEIVGTGHARQPFPPSFEVLLYPQGDRAKSFGEGRDSRDEDIARLLRQQTALVAFGSFALGANDLGMVLTEAARVCADSLTVPFCKICRYRLEENDLLVEAGVGWKPGVVGAAVSRADASSPQGRAFSTGKPVICADLRKDKSFVLPGCYVEHGIVSTLDVVIRPKEGDGRPWGVLEIDNPKPHVYDEYDVNFLTGFANVLAEAVKASRRNAVVQPALDQMKDIGSYLVDCWQTLIPTADRSQPRCSASAPRASSVRRQPR
jgi:ActR/RegA family two-component response regulator/putative methionine-R-sulfoxide reductase with GAF domain